MSRTRKSVLILSGNHLCHNPRVLKEATTLGEAGYDVTVIGGWIDPEIKRRDEALLRSAPFRFEPVVDMTRVATERLLSRTRRRFGAELHRWLGIENSWQLGYAVEGLRRAMRDRRPDLLIAHSEQSLTAAAEFHRAGGKIAIDMEDWFSEDLLPASRQIRPLSMLRRLERETLRASAYVSCPSQAMAHAFAQEYGCAPPVVIYNAFDRVASDDLRRDRPDRSVPSIHWFSQTLGDGRGLSDLVAALPHLRHPAQIHLRGQPVAGFGHRLRLTAPAQWRDKIHIHPLVSNGELSARIAEHDIGFAGDPPSPRNRDLTATNKILQYLTGGLAVIASDTAGHREVAGQAKGAVALYPSGNPRALAAQINTLLETPGQLARTKAASHAAGEIFSWKQQRSRLLDAVGLAIGSPASVAA